MAVMQIGASFSANTTCDIFRSGHATSGTPDVAAAACLLTPDFAQAHSVQTTGTTTMRWTHIALYPLATDIRDGYLGGGPTGETVPSGWDTVCVPSKTGTAFAVIFVERIHQATGGGPNSDYLRVYLQRQTPSWPTNNF